MTEPVVSTGQEPTEPSDGLSFDGDFDAERAKGLIERLREENKSLKGDKTPQDQKDARAIAELRRQVEQLKPKADQFSALEEASKTEAQRLADATASAQREAETARADATRYKAAATFGIPADHFDLLGSGTEDEINARAEKLQALLATPAAPGAPAVPSRPVEQLRPGATPGEPVNEDDAVYARLFGAPKA